MKFSDYKSAVVAACVAGTIGAASATVVKCGAGGAPACMGDELDGREFECDYGYVSEDGVCVPWMPTPSGPDCGTLGQVVCSGDDMDGREFECDYGFINHGGLCVPWTAEMGDDDDDSDPPVMPPTTPRPATPPPPPPTPLPAKPTVPPSDPVTPPAEKAATATPVTPPPPPPPPPTQAPVETMQDGQMVFNICIQGESQNFGPIEGENGVTRGEGVTITNSGQCSWQEYAGGFDGFPSGGINDGHEKGMDEAITQMFPGNYEKQTAFLQEMIRIADPVDLDWPDDKAIADGGERMRNIGKLNAACSQLITIQC